MKKKKEPAKIFFSNLFPLVIPVRVKTFTLAVHLICILLHDAAEGNRQRELKQGRIRIK